MKPTVLALALVGLLLPLAAARAQRAHSVVEWDGESSYHFTPRRTYLHHKKSAGRVVEERDIAGKWGCATGPVDAAVHFGVRKLYLFFGSQYARYDMDANACDPGYPKAIAGGGWPGLPWASDIDAAVAYKGKAYFFKGPLYVRYDIAADRADPGYPMSLGAGWPGVWPDGVDAAVNNGAGKVILFKGDKAISYDIAGERADGPEFAASAYLGTVPTPPAPAAPPRIEILDARRSPTGFVEFGLWDGAFPDDNRPCGPDKPLNGPTEDRNFVGSDSRRFHIRVTDPAAAAAGRDRIEVDWWTERPPSTAIDKPAASSVTLVAESRGSGVYVSPALLLVTDPWETSNQSTTSGLGGAALVPRGQSGYRMRVATLDSRVVVQYRRAGVAEAYTGRAQVFRRSPEDRRILPVQFYFFNRPAPTADYIRKELGFIRKIYARVGIHIVAVLPAIPSPARVMQVGGDRVMLIDNWALLDPVVGVKQDHVKSVADSYPPMAANTLRLFYVGKLERCGADLNPNGCNYAEVPGATFVAHWSTGGGTSAAAHEMSHALGLPHLKANPSPGSRLAASHNLLVDPPAVRYFGGICYPGRLWDMPGMLPQGMVNQHQVLRSSPYVRRWPAPTRSGEEVAPVEVDEGPAPGT